MRITDHCFTSTAPVFGMDPDDFADPFFDSAEMTARESERPLSSERVTHARAGHAAGSRSRDGSDNQERNH